MSRNPFANGGPQPPLLPGSPGEDNKYLPSSLPVWHIRAVSLTRCQTCLEQAGSQSRGPGAQLTPLARVINGLVGLQKEVPPARGEEQVEALNVCLSGQRVLQPW